MEIHQDPVPLRVDEDGQVRVGSTRVIFKLVVEAYLDGASPEEISEKIYTSLKLEDTYGAIAYYLRHQEEVREYMRQWDAEAEKVRQMIEASQPDRAELKARLLARKAEMEKNGTWGVKHAPAPQ
jgi:uncharacterized protein (DUF433 family)